MRDWRNWLPWVGVLVILALYLIYVFRGQSTITPAEIWGFWKSMARQDPLLVVLIAISVFGYALLRTLYGDRIRKAIFRAKWPLIFPLALVVFLIYYFTKTALHQEGKARISSLVLVILFPLILGIAIWISMRRRD